MIHQLINSGVAHYSGILYHGTSFGAHFHNSYELIWMLEGTASLTICGKNVTAAAGELILISPCVVHEIHADAKASFFIAVIAPGYITDYAETHKNDLAVRFTIDSDAGALVEKMLIGRKLPPPYALKACFYLILSFAENGSVLLHADQYDITFVYAVNSHIAGHFTEPLRRQDLAQLLGYEEHYFSCLFKKNFGMGLRKYLNTYRISHACQLLTTTDQTVSAIALGSGFSSVREFNTVFGELLGMTPTAYRGGKIASANKAAPH